MSDKVEKLTGVRPTLFRPPYGDYNNRVVEVSRAEGYECVVFHRLCLQGLGVLE